VASPDGLSHRLLGVFGVKYPTGMVASNSLRMKSDGALCLEEGWVDDVPLRRTLSVKLVVDGERCGRGRFVPMGGDRIKPCTP